MDDEDIVVRPPPRRTDAWMLSFGDLVSLMLVFFVMLFAMSTIQEEDFEAVVSTMSQRFNPLQTVSRPVPQVDSDIPKVIVPRGYSLDYLRAVVAEKFERDALLSDVRFHLLDDRLVISLPSELLFDPGSPRLTAEARESIFVLGDVLRYISNRVDVNGHSDPSPGRSTAFPSDWELSLSRAIAVANELRRSGYTRRIIAFGYAASRFEDLSTTLPAPVRFELARRVDIVIRRDQGDEAFLAR